jgi:hypothetical protein
MRICYPVRPWDSGLDEIMPNSQMKFLIDFKSTREIHGYPKVEFGSSPFHSSLDSPFGLSLPSDALLHRSQVV